MDPRPRSGTRPLHLPAGLSRRAAALFLFGLLLGLGTLWIIRDLGRAALDDRLSTFSTIFLGIFIEAVPFLLLGTLASGLVEEFLPQEVLHRWLPHGRLRAVLAGAGMGLLFPVCECGTVPLARRLLRKGLPLPVAISFLLAAPVVNPIVLFSTASAFGLGPMLALRFGLTLLIAVLTGLIFAVDATPHRLLRATVWAPVQGGSGQAAPLPSTDRPATSAAPHHDDHDDPSQERGAKLNRALAIAADEFFEMGRYLVMGSVLAALLQTFVPQTSLLAVGSGPLLSVLVMLVLAVVLSICSTVDSFVALAFLGSFTRGSVLAFLVYGPMVDIKSTLMYLTVFRRKTVAYLVLLPLAMTLVLAVFMNLYLPGG